MDLFRHATGLVRLLPPETAHGLTLGLLAAGLYPGRGAPDLPRLRIRVWQRDFANPIGLAAGFDKDANAVDMLPRLGFGFVEVGSILPRPQPGNDRPRLFRLPEDRAVINRMGFNSKGLAYAEARLRARRRGSCIVGVNLGANKDTVDRVADYQQGIAALAPHADYLVINVSSPNTPGLRALQQRSELAELLARVGEVPRSGVPLVLKIAPDIDRDEATAIAELALEHQVHGLIVGNTTVSRPAGLKNRNAAESGGLSGRPLMDLATAKLKEMYRLTAGRIPLVGTGGVTSGDDAYEKVLAGASLVQLYTALIYQGPSLVGRILRRLDQRLADDGFDSIERAVGAGAED